MFEYLPLIAFQIAFAAAGLAILYRIVGGKLSAAEATARKPTHGEIFRRAANTSHA